MVSEYVRGNDRNDYIMYIQCIYRQIDHMGGLFSHSADSIVDSIVSDYHLLEYNSDDDSDSPCNQVGMIGELDDTHARISTDSTTSNSLDSTSALPIQSTPIPYSNSTTLEPLDVGWMWHKHRPYKPDSILKGKWMFFVDEPEDLSFLWELLKSKLEELDAPEIRRSPPGWAHARQGTSTGAHARHVTSSSAGTHARHGTSPSSDTKTDTPTEPESVGKSRIPRSNTSRAPRKPRGVATSPGQMRGVLLVYTDGDELNRARIGLQLTTLLTPYRTGISEHIHWKSAYSSYCGTGPVDNLQLRYRIHYDDASTSANTCNHCGARIGGRIRYNLGRCAACHDCVFFRIRGGKYDGMTYYDFMKQGLPRSSLPHHELYQFDAIRRKSCIRCHRFDGEALPCPSGLCTLCFAAGHAQFSSGQFAGKSAMTFELMTYDGEECSQADLMILRRAKSYLTTVAKRWNHRDVLRYNNMPRASWVVLRLGAHYFDLATHLTKMYMETSTPQDTDIPRADGLGAPETLPDNHDL